MLMCSGRWVMASLLETRAGLRDGHQTGALPAAQAEQSEQARVLDGEKLDRVGGRVVVVAVPRPRGRVDEVAARPAFRLVLDLAVPRARQDKVDGLVVVALHVRGEPGRDGLPEDLEGRRRQPARDPQL